jgi:hypothetical protein
VRRVGARVISHQAPAVKYKSRSAGALFLQRNGAQRISRCFGKAHARSASSVKCATENIPAKVANGGVIGSGQHRVTFVRNKKIVLFGFFVALFLLIGGFFAIATAPWGHIMMGLGLFLLINQAIRQ